MSARLNKADAEKAKAVAASVQSYINSAQKQQSPFNKVSAYYEKLKSEQRVKNKVVIKEVQKIIDRPVYRNICIDANGVSAINSLIPKIPANLLVPCADLQELESGQGSDLMLWSVDTVIQYNQCQTKHGAIVKALE